MRRNWVVAPPKANSLPRRRHHPRRAAKIQNLYLAGDKKSAIAAVLIRE